MSRTIVYHCAPEAVLLTTFMGSERSAHQQQQHRSASWAGGHPAAHGSHSFPVPTFHDGPGKPFNAISDAFPPQGTENLPEVRAPPFLPFSIVTVGSWVSPKGLQMSYYRAISCLHSLIRAVASSESYSSQAEAHVGHLQVADGLS